MGVHIVCDLDGEGRGVECAHDRVRGRVSLTHQESGMKIGAVVPAAEKR